MAHDKKLVKEQIYSINKSYNQTAIDTRDFI